MERFFVKKLSLERKIKEPHLEPFKLRAPSLTLRIREKSSESMQKEYSQRLEYKKVLKKLDITPNPHRLRNPFKKKVPTFLEIPKAKVTESDESDFDLLIQSLFYGKINELTLPKSDNDPPIDYFEVELGIRNLKRIQPIFLAPSEEEDVLKSPIEEYWYKNISQHPYVRWDLFEESLISSFILGINTNLGLIRKINWNWLLRRLYVKLSSHTNDIELFPGHPALPPVYFNGPIVTLRSFSSLIVSGKLRKLLLKSVNFNTYYLTERFKQPFYQYACNTTYKGHWKNFKREGMGKLIFPNKTFYDGYFFQGLRHGYGTLSGDDNVYVGYWNRDLIHGSGELVYFDESKIEGVWRNGVIHSGKLLWTGGEYNGFMNHLGFNGTGNLISKNGDVKKGNWAKSKLEGQGEILYKNGVKYIGNFEQDVLEGTGLIENPEFVYYGQVKNFKPHGNGKIVYKNQTEFEGEFLNGEITGKGVFKINDITMKGDFVQGKLSGNGEKIKNKHYQYIGEFYDGMMHGKGKIKIFHEDLNAKYKGQFKFNKFHGLGKLSIAKMIVTGEWAKGQNHGNCSISHHKFDFRGNFIAGVIKVKASIHFENGAIYDGLWENSLPNGKGEAIDETGYRIAAYFLNGYPVMKNRLSTKFFENFNDLLDNIELLKEKLKWIDEKIFTIQ